MKTFIRQRIEEARGKRAKRVHKPRGLGLKERKRKAADDSRRVEKRLENACSTPVVLTGDPPAPEPEAEWVEPDYVLLTKWVRGRQRKKAAEGKLILTLREQQIINGLWLGLSKSEIAAALELQLGTVETHLAKVCRQAGIAGPRRIADLFLRYNAALREAVPITGLAE